MVVMPKVMKMISVTFWATYEAEIISEYLISIMHMLKSGVAIKGIALL